MNCTELIQKLNKIEVKPSLYSLNGELKPDSIILLNSYNDWIVFYLDERGGRNDEKIFKSEDEACIYIYNLLIKMKEMEGKFNLST
jgi:hypothetical protein